jgi:hypothetical protein
MSSKGACLITNRHLVTGRRQDNDQPLSKTGGIPDQITIIHNRKGKLGRWVPKPQKLDNTPWVEHPKLGAKADFVALPLADLSDVELFPYTFTRPGQSGSPVIYHSSGLILTSDGDLQLRTGPTTRWLGVYSGRINEQSDIGMVWKAKAVAELIDSM